MRRRPGDETLKLYKRQRGDREEGKPASSMEQIVAQESGWRNSWRKRIGWEGEPAGKDEGLATVSLSVDLDGGITLEEI